MSSSSSPDFSSPCPKNGLYDVFLSFRGADTRYGFTANLYQSLKNKKIFSFMDIKNLGYDIKRLFEMVAMSKVALVVYSENFADSPWCLKELKLILQRREEKMMLIIPIFYNIDVDELKHLTGKTGKYLDGHIQKHGETIVKEWKTAVSTLGYVSGLSYKITHGRYEFEFIAEVIAKTKEKLEEWEQTLQSTSKPYNSGPATEYDVFISFMGEDTRFGLVNHLYEALMIRKAMRTFMDDRDLLKDDNIFEVIQRSKIAVVVFSKKYASSKWCLRELVKILQCRNDTMGQLVVLPIFYKITPKDLINQAATKGSMIACQLEKHVLDHEEAITVESWRNSITELGNMDGWPYSTAHSKRPEFIRGLVEEISTILNRLDEKKESTRNQQACRVSAKAENTQALAENTQALAVQTDSKSKVQKNQEMEHSMSENSCQLCAVKRLTFEPPPIYCTPCGSRIKRNAMYYTVGAGDTRHYFCILCYNDARGDTIVAGGAVIPKMRLEKKKNDEEPEEWWFQCDKCEGWQHQICALFNGLRNDGGQAEYTCPNCYTDEVEKGERKPLPQSAVLGAKDLPKTILSDHIEQRLAKKLRQERLERAKQQNKAYDEVPGAEALVVRVVSSVDKKLEVKQRFLEIFQEQNYPTEFPYKSKVVLLFQKIEGVEVCLFGMYVQEFGSECLHPNQRRVYLSYLDSVKYFRPEIKSVTGEALRTFVYHEILIGYLEYCKLRGFASFYIWACPPLNDEDYILYCHPEILETPKSDKLREWYLAMLKKATKENIVVDLTNLYDHFFTSTGECKAKVTAARLPYFDGDYWPGAAEELIYQIRQEEDGKKLNKKGTMKKTITKRALKASGHDLTGNGSKDLLLMRRLGETISPMKEDFIMVHLQHPCAHCCILMVSGNRWVCSVCKNFQICDKCYEAEQNREQRERHPMYHRDVHSLYPIQINEIPDDTKDRDEILESEFFDTRQAFLSLCQGNHYQYDTLRRAKHSSMMVLYHLHNPTAPAFVTICNICSLDIEASPGWHCEVCPEYDVCNACYKKGWAVEHPHKLISKPPLADRDAQNQEARQLRVLQLREMLDLLVHSSQCRSSQCQYPNCRKVKGLYRHGINCKLRASGGCVLCKKMWYLLQLHARACKESECPVPRCKDLKEHLRRLQQQSDTRRRAAVMEMMRQRAAEVASNDG